MSCGDCRNSRAPGTSASCRRSRPITWSALTPRSASGLRLTKTDALLVDPPGPPPPPPVPGGGAPPPPPPGLGVAEGGRLVGGPPGPPPPPPAGEADDALDRRVLLHDRHHLVELLAHRLERDALVALHLARQAP